MRANSSNSFSRFTKRLGISLATLAIAGCGSDCSVIQGLVGDPGCHRLGLDGSRTFVGTLASCANATSSRRLTVNCPSTAGTASHCNSALNGFPVLSLLVLNNQSGSFIDSDETVYNNCQDLLTAFDNGLLKNVAGIFTSNASISGDTVSCSDSGGCAMTSQECYAGWDSVDDVISGTASIPLGTKVLACTYIDTTALGGPAPISVGTWASSPAQYTIGGDLSFTNGWVDAR